MWIKFKWIAKNKIITLVSIIVVSLISISIFTTRRSVTSESPITGVDSFTLTQGQIKDYREKANAGNLEAARSLHQYYAFVTSDYEQEKFWAKKAAELGDDKDKKNFEFYEEREKMDNKQGVKK